MTHIIGWADFRKVSGLVRIKTFVDRFVEMVLENVFANEPTHGSPGNDIGSKMLLGCESGDADDTCQRVRNGGNDFSSLVFVRDKRCKRPRHHGMPRWKTALALEKAAISTGQIRPLPSRTKFEDAHHD